MSSAIGTISRRAILGLLLFGVAFGYVEAAVVAYLRDLHEPARQRFHPGRPAGDLFPLLTLDQLRSAGPEQQRTLAIEIGREAATLVMLAAAALVLARRPGDWAAAFGVAFGAWDIAFYLFLKLLLDWPQSLLTWDILFLIPVPWTGPVLAPLIVSAAMIAAGLRHLLGSPVRLRAAHWLGITLGAGVIVWSFTLDCRHIMAGGMPRSFPWPLFALGLVTGLASYAAARRGARKPAAMAAMMFAGIAPAGWVPARWPADPKTLDLLQGTPVNCLLVEGEPGADFLSEARRRGIEVLPPGWENAAREGWPVLNAKDAVAPGVRAVSDSDAAGATPTAEPWIDSNLWLARSLGSLHGPRPVWLGHTLENPSENDYLRAIADAASGGARWVVAPDAKLIEGLLRREPAALAAWRRISETLELFERHAEWRRFTPAAALGIVRDASLPDRTMSDENLNLITRRRIPYRIIERASLTPASLEGLPVVLAADLSPPTIAERKILAEFEKRGGAVVFAGNPPDPDALSRELVELIGNDRLPVRLFNVPSVLAQVSTGGGGSRLLVQLVNYATAPAGRITLRAAGVYRAARLFAPGAPPAELKTVSSGGKTETRLESMAVYAAVLLEK